MRTAAPAFATLNTSPLVTMVALLALLAPILTPLSPQLAGWLPSHGHVYRDGVPVAHSHPADSGRLTPSLICGLHGAPHPAPASAPADRQPESSPGDDSVAFTFEGLGLFGSVAPPSAGSLPACPDEVLTRLARVSAPVASAAPVPLAPPPRG